MVVIAQQRNFCCDVATNFGPSEQVIIFNYWHTADHAAKTATLADRAH